MFSTSSCREFSLDEIKEATNDFDKSKVLGKGGEGKVYLASLRIKKTIVAVKHLHSNSKDFDNEIQTISKIQHPNLVSLLGFCKESSHQILIYEYMEKGSLSNYVHSKSTSYVPWLQRLRICLGAARGLQHLHTETADHPKGIIHRDIKPANILIDENWVGKISDFGMSKLSKAGQATSSMATLLKGTAGYYAPEYILHNRITRKIDVRAFGVVLFQVLCGKMPWDRGEETYIARDDEDLGHWAAQNIDIKIKREISEDCLKVFTDIIKRSLRPHPAERPTMDEVVLDLEKAMNIQQTEEEGKRLHTTVFRPMDPRLYFPTAREGSIVYHVSVTYRWETRKTLAIPLYQALECAGFRTFLDPSKHSDQCGTVSEAIENSMCAVVILSKNFTSSHFCLEEVRLIVERAKASNFSVLPIYYEVEPTYIRNLNGREFEKLRKDHRNEVDLWRTAIEEFAEYNPIIMSGDPNKLPDKIVDMVRNEFSHFPTKFSNH